MRMNLLHFFFLFSLCWVNSIAHAQLPDPLNSKQHRLVEQISTIFENSSPDFQYAYIEDIEDGAGITAGRVGFNRYSLYEFVQIYTQNKPHNRLSKYLPCLNTLTEDGLNYACLFPSVPKNTLKTKHFREKTLRYFDFGRDFIRSARDPIMRKTQDQIVERNIYQPAIEWFHKLHLKTPIGFLIVYDSILQQGIDDLQGLKTMLRLTPPWNGNELEWLQEYMKVRKDDQMHPFYPDGVTRYETAPYKCYPRSDALIEILNSKNTELQTPLSFEYFGEHFKL